jgi:hypothetical protein
MVLIQLPHIARNRLVYRFVANPCQLLFSIRVNHVVNPCCQPLSTLLPTPETHKAISWFQQFYLFIYLFSLRRYDEGQAADAVRGGALHVGIKLTNDP